MINARCLAVKLKKQDDVNRFTDPLSDCAEMLQNIAANRKLTIGMIDDMIFFCTTSSSRKFTLNSGLKTLGEMIGVSPDAMERISNDPKPFPEAKIMELFPDGNVNEGRIRHTIGEKFQVSMIRSIVQTSTNSIKYKQILKQKTARDAVESGLIHPAQAASLIQSRNAMKKEAENDEMFKRPCLYGQVTLLFPQRDKSGKIIKGGPVREVIIKGNPTEILVKKKHYYLFSLPGCGKSTEVRTKILNEYRAAFITDIKNAYDIPEHAQILIIDEYGGSDTTLYRQAVNTLKGSNKYVLDEDVLKGITAGDASGKAINRKSHGGSFVPTADMQLIILSNMSIYEAHAKYSPAEGRRVVNKMLLEAIEQRFHVHCVDTELDPEEVTSKAKLMVTPYADMSAEEKKEFEEILFSTEKGQLIRQLEGQVHVTAELYRGLVEACINRLEPYIIHHDYIHPSVLLKNILPESRMKEMFPDKHIGWEIVMQELCRKDSIFLLKGKKLQEGLRIISDMLEDKKCGIDVNSDVYRLKRKREGTENYSNGRKKIRGGRKVYGPQSVCVYNSDSE